jgi:hypothetical protein
MASLVSNHCHTPLRSAGYSPPTQDLLPAVGQTLLDGLVTRRVPMRGVRVSTSSHPPLPSLPGAIDPTDARIERATSRPDLVSGLPIGGGTTPSRLEVTHRRTLARSHAAVTETPTRAASQVGLDEREPLPSTERVSLNRRGPSRAAAGSRPTPVRSGIGCKRGIR